MVTLVGEPRQIGGNTAQLTSKGNVRITDAQGNVKDISAKNFQKQLLKNADKIANGDNFEFKSNSNAKVIATGVGIVGAAAGLTAAVIYRKNISQYAKDLYKAVKETNWNKVGKDLGKKWNKTIKPKIEKTYNTVAETVKDAFRRGKNALTNFFETTGNFLKKTYEALKNYRNKK